MSILKNLRTEKNKENNINITQEKLAEELLVAPQTVQLWERTDNISRRNLEALISFYGLSQKECDDLVFSLYRITVDPTNKNEYVKGSINSNYAMEMIVNDKEGISVVFDDTKTFRHLIKETSDIYLSAVGPANSFETFINPWKIPKNIPYQLWIDNMINLFSKHHAFDKFEKSIFSNAVYEIYEENGVMDACRLEDWKEEVSKQSTTVNFASVYKKMKDKRDELEFSRKHSLELEKNKTMAVLTALEPFSRSYSLEHRLYGTSEGRGIDECFTKIVIFEEIKNYRNPILGFIKDAIIQYCNMIADKGKISIYSTVEKRTMVNNLLPYYHVFVVNEKEYLSDKECRTFIYNNRIEKT